jgi:hypothetical protein
VQNPPAAQTYILWLKPIKNRVDPQNVVFFNLTDFPESSILVAAKMKKT